jgi:hypothetical protein
VQLAEEIATFVTGGVAVVVATRDGDLRPQAGRGWGPLILPAGDAMTLCIGVPAGSRMRSNLEQGSPVVATFSQPTSYRTVQIKGDVLELGEPTAAQLARVEEHYDVLARETEQVGFSRELLRRLMDRALVAVTFSARELYDQTPGVNAGARL